MRKSKISRSLYKVGLAAIGVGVYDYNSNEQILTRIFRTARCGFMILVNYKIRFSPELANEIHDYTAKDIYDTCIVNDGLYVKFGQGMASFDHMLPPPYAKHLKALQDRARPNEYSQVAMTFQEDTGKDFHEVFAEFEEIPVAAASIAQTHKARLKTGEAVAVKIQKRNIRPQYKSDLFMHYLICAVIEYSFDLPLLYFADFIEDTLKEELDFRKEAANAIKSKKFLEGTKRKDVYIPKIYEELTTERVMVSEWIDGIKVTDKEGLEKASISISETVESVVSAFSQQLFSFGFLHCDPHPGNILVRKNPKNKSEGQIVILDFGLCVTIPEKFKVQYAQFWKALYFKDFEALKVISREWGIGNEEAFASAQMMKPYSNDKPINHKPSKQEIYSMQMKFKEEMNKMMKETQKFPKELIFIGRSMNLVRSINKEHGSRVNRIDLIARSAIESLEISHQKSLWKRMNLKAKIYLNSWINWFFTSSLYIFKGKNVEDYLEEESQKQIDEKFIQYGFKVPDSTMYDA